MIALHPASQQDQATLGNLMQLYTYDWSQLRPLDVADNGRFEDYPLDAYWKDDWRHPFLVRADGKLAGFALVSARSRLTGAEGVFDMAEFFVLRRYRRTGVGQQAAVAAFDRFRGLWEIRQREDNVEASAFWRRVVSRYTDGKYHELPWSDAKWTGPVQRFSNDSGQCW